MAFERFNKWKETRRAYRQQIEELDAVVSRAISPKSKGEVSEGIMEIVKEHYGAVGKEEFEIYQKIANEMADVYLSQKKDSNISTSFVSEAGVTDIKYDTYAREIFKLFEKSDFDRSMVEFGKAKLKLLEIRGDIGKNKDRDDKIAFGASMSFFAFATVSFAIGSTPLGVAAASVAMASMIVALWYGIRGLRASKLEGKLIESGATMFRYMMSSGRDGKMTQGLADN
jgi:hypothetical protein